MKEGDCPLSSSLGLSDCPPQRQTAAYTADLLTQRLHHQHGVITGWRKQERQNDTNATVSTHVGIVKNVRATMKAGVGSLNVPAHSVLL